MTGFQNHLTLICRNWEELLAVFLGLLALVKIFGNRNLHQKSRKVENELQNVWGLLETALNKQLCHRRTAVQLALWFECDTDYGTTVTDDWRAKVFLFYDVGDYGKMATTVEAKTRRPRSWGEGGGEESCRWRVLSPGSMVSISIFPLTKMFREVFCWFRLFHPNHQREDINSSGLPKFHHRVACEVKTFE